MKYFSADVGSLLAGVWFLTNAVSGSSTFSFNSMQTCIKILLFIYPKLSVYFHTQNLKKLPKIGNFN
jgi:hypothetical protein